jgi:hypothetical protein
MLRTLGLSLFAVTSLVTTAATAHAEESVHDYATLDRANGTTGAGVDMSFILGKADFPTVQRLDLHGEYMHDSGLGLYGAVAVSRVSIDAMDFGSQTALSNGEIGAQARRRVGEFTLGARAGLVLPTATGGDEGALVNLLAGQRRYADIMTALPDVTAARLGVSASWHRGMVFARADIGADIALSQPKGSEIDPIMHANLAVGAVSGRFSGALELVTAATTGTLDENDERFKHSAALSLRYAPAGIGGLVPSLNIVTPLDDRERGELISIGAGLSKAF